MTEPTFSVALLVGGRGRRLGGTDKSALVVGGRTILERQVDAARAVTPSVLAVGSMTGHGPAGLPLVPDLLPDGGALGALVTALVAAPADVVVVVAGDMPFVTGPFLRWLAERLGPADAVLPQDAGGRHPLCAAYHRRAAAPLRVAVDAGVRRVQDAVGTLRCVTVGPEDYREFDPDGRLLLNINTPGDYHAALDRHP
ncbi:MAG: molybdenum cofactor guanylyltransferase [Vicinamibacterales bacterium]